MRAHTIIETGIDATGYTVYTARATSKGLRCIPTGYDNRKDAMRYFQDVAVTGAWCRVVEHTTAEDRIGNIIAEAGSLPGRDGMAFAKAKYYARKA